MKYLNIIICFLPLLDAAFGKGVSVSAHCSSQVDKTQVGICLRPWLDLWETLRTHNAVDAELNFPILYYSKDTGLGVSQDPMVHFVQAHMAYFCGDNAVFVLSKWDCVNAAVRTMPRCRNLIRGIPLPSQLAGKCTGIPEFYNCVLPDIQQRCGTAGTDILNQSLRYFGCALNGKVKKGTTRAGRIFHKVPPSVKKPAVEKKRKIDILTNDENLLKDVRRDFQRSLFARRLAAIQALVQAAEDSTSLLEDIEAIENGRVFQLNKPVTSQLSTGKPSTTTEADIEGSADFGTDPSSALPAIIKIEDSGSNEAEYSEESDFLQTEEPVSDEFVTDSTLNRSSTALLLHTTENAQTATLTTADFTTDNFSQPNTTLAALEIDAAVTEESEFGEDVVSTESTSPADQSQPSMPPSHVAELVELTNQTTAGIREQPPELQNRFNRSLIMGTNESQPVVCGGAEQVHIARCMVPLSQQWDELHQRMPAARVNMFPLFNYSTSDLLHLCDTLGSVIQDCLDRQAVFACAESPLITYVNSLLGFACGPHQSEFFLAFDCIHNTLKQNSHCLALLEGRNGPGVPLRQRCANMPAFYDCMEAQLASQCEFDSLRMFLRSILNFGCDVAPKKQPKTLTKLELPVLKTTIQSVQRETSTISSTEITQKSTAGRTHTSAQLTPAITHIADDDSLCTDAERTKARKCLLPMLQRWSGYRDLNPRLNTLTFPLYLYPRAELLEVCDEYANAFLCGGGTDIYLHCIRDTFVRFANDHWGYICSPQNLADFLRHYDCIMQVQLDECTRFVRGVSVPDNKEMCTGVQAFYECQKPRILGKCGSDALDEFISTIYQFGCTLEDRHKYAQCIKLLWLPNPVSFVDNHDEFYIILDAANIFTCNDVENQLEISKEDVIISDGEGNQVHYIKAPGNYSIHFTQIAAPKDLPNLSGEIAADLQVPLLSGSSGIRLDFPYTVIPETGIVPDNYYTNLTPRVPFSVVYNLWHFNTNHVSSRCDAHSGIVQHKGPNGESRQYCRYCDICSSITAAEKDLNSGRRKIIPEQEVHAERIDSAFGHKPECTQVGAGIYEFKRKVSLPGRRELERRVRQQYSDLENEVRQRLEKGTGRFQVQLNLFSSSTAPRDAREFLQAHPTCRCCLGSWFAGGLECLLSRFLKCSEEKCKGEYAAKCLQGDVTHVACYLVEFNYQATSNFNEVRHELAKKGIDVDHPAPVKVNNRNRQAKIAASKSSVIDAPEPITLARRQQLCADEIRRRPDGHEIGHLARYCTVFWETDTCCVKCPEACNLV